MGNPHGALNCQCGLDRCCLVGRLVTYGRSYAPRTVHADAKRLEIRTSNLIEDVRDVVLLTGRDAVLNDYAFTLFEGKCVG